MLRLLFAARYSLLALVMAGGVAHAQGWPQRPVKVLVPFAAGGNIDVMGRLAAGRLSETLGQQFIVENRVGGNGALAAEAVARAAPDGYLLLWGATNVISIFPAITKVLFDPVKDFAPVSLFSVAPQVLVVNPKVPVHNVAEFVAYVRSQSQKLPYGGGGGPGSTSNLLMALFLKRAGLEMTSVSYRGTAPALTDLIAGHIPTMFVPIAEALPQARAGLIRMLAVSSGARNKQAPEVPTVAESGYPGFSLVSWTGLMAPAGTPTEIVERMSGELGRALKDPQFVQNIDKAGADPASDARPSEFAAFIAKEMVLWGEAVKIAGVSLQQ
ncbi:MAG: tripartite tricarboxylate transporter substrate binding protein [Hyphomicrobiales bacterium]|nr:tripartite tricarboxylate transporter substrate binding protein [Hyphomicrobiales bacterium]